ncbi:MAG: peptidyl-prolyl cis-trans isomerase, partial [bacterium]
WHVYVSGARATAAADAAALAAQLRRAGAPGRGPLGGDAFPLPAHLQGQSRQQLEKVIGREVAAAAFAAAPQRWIGPLRSPLGLHVLWVSRRDDAATPPLAAVRGRVLEAWQQEQRAQRIAALLRALRERAEVRVESRPWQERRKA